MIDIAGYDFEGMFRDVEEIKEELGAYVVLCLVEGNPHCVLDVGISEGGIPWWKHSGSSERVATSTGNLKHRLKYHDRKSCWKENVHGKIGYCVKYISDRTNRINLERKLQWKLEFACGTNPWEEIEKAWREYQEYKDKFGPRGDWTKIVLGRS